MDFSHQASGQVVIGGCSAYKWIAYFRLAYGVGSILYFKPKALKGIFEKVVIKDAKFPKWFNSETVKRCKGCKVTPLYIDTLNAYFNENELVSYDEAVDLVLEYEENLKERIQQLAANGYCVNLNTELECSSTT